MVSLNDLSEHEVQVLRAYANAKRHGVTMTMAQVAAVTHLTNHSVRKAAIELRALELLEGSRMLRITDKGERLLAGEEVERPTPPDPEPEPTPESTPGPELGPDSGHDFFFFTTPSEETKPDQTDSEPEPESESEAEPEDEEEHNPDPEDDFPLPSPGTDAVLNLSGPDPEPEPKPKPKPEPEPSVKPAPVAVKPRRVVMPDERGRKLSELLAEQLHVDARRVLDIMRSVIHTSPSEQPPSNEELFTVMSTVQRYKLDPWVKQLHAFRSKGKLVVLVGYDGWVEIANRQPGFKGVTYEYSDEEVTIGGVTSWKWIKATCHSEGRYPTEIYCFFEEWYVPQMKQPGPWQKHPRHRHRQKAFTMAVREHFGISLYDEVDADVIRSYETSSEMVARATEAKIAMLKREGADE